ncbi:Peroxisome biosynthesis protein pex1 [Thecaphora frezii]
MSRPKARPRSAKPTRVRVQFEHSLHSSLVHLPMSLYAPLVDRQVSPQSLVVQINPCHDANTLASHSFPQQPYYAGWSGMSAAPHNVASSFATASPSSSSGASLADVISMSPSLAASFSPPLAEGTICSIRLFRSPPLPTAEKIEVTPLSPDDWEILSIHAEEVENNMLGQVRAAKTGQVIGVHVGRASKTVVRFRVDATTPATSTASAAASSIDVSACKDEEEQADASENVAVRLTTDSEVIIAPRLREKVEDPAAEESHDLNATKSAHGGIGQAKDQEERRQAVSKMLWRVLPNTFVRSIGSEDRLYSTVLFPPSNGRAATVPGPDYDEIEALFPNGRITITKMSCPSSDAAKSRADEARADDATASTKADAGASGGQEARSTSGGLPARPTASASFASGNGYLQMGKPDSQPSAAAWPHRHVLVGPTLRQQLGLQDYDLVRFTSAPPGSTSRTSTPNGVANGDSHSAHGDESNAPSPTKTLAGVDSLLSTCLDIVSGTLRSRRLHAAVDGAIKPFAGSSGLLLTGGAGSGKTVVAEELSARLSNDFGTLMATSRIDCSPFSEERVPTLRAKFSEWLNEAAWKAPSLLVLDNIDRIIPAEVEHVDSHRSRQLAEAFVARIRDCVKDYEVFVLATAQSNTSIHSLLNSSHLWIDNVQLKPPSKEGRREILAHLVRAKTSTWPQQPEEQDNDLNFVTLATRTEGYLPADLRDLVERAVHQSAIRAAAQDITGSHEAEARLAPLLQPVTNGDAAHSTSAAPNGAAPQPVRVAASFELTMTDFTQAQDGFTPLSLRDIKLEKSTVAWSDIGGLVETRRVLRETLEWPTKYAAIFASCPLRLRSGLLLYGYPGCGKTLLASAVAKECGLNFISVKGPEILNKYIGASEKSVRDLFDRAQAAKPCVLFFDEFDSIAPKRGHDSTGVTDRVVNQMLTQMDGAEGLDGVYVLAATSRPDLIDSALLRPGRLDKSLLCDMPSLEDRVDIIRAIARKVHLDPNVDVEHWAERTEGYSGADLQALLYNAHLETIHESINAALPSAADASAAVSREAPSGKPLRFASFGGGAGKGKTLSGAERQALSRKLELVLQNQRKTTSSSSSLLQAAGKKSAGKKVLVTDQHLEASLKATRPSVPLEEQKRLRRIYKSFAGERDAHFPDGEASDQIGARSSLM